MTAHSEAPPWVLWALHEAKRVTVGRGTSHNAIPDGSEVFGCGAFGCVMPVPSSRDWVCKVSIEGSEAFFARAQTRIEGRLNQAHRELPQGVAYYADQLRVDSPAGPLWLVWRRAAEMPTYRDFVRSQPAMPRDRLVDLLFVDDDVERARVRTEQARMKAQWTEKHGTDCFEILDALTSAGMLLADSFVSLARGSPELLSRALEAGDAEAARIFAPRENLGAWSYGNASSDEAKAALRLMGYRFQLRRLAKSPTMPELAHALGFYLDQGFTVPISSDWAPLWRQSKVDVGVWFNRWPVYDKLAASLP